MPHLPSFELLYVFIYQSGSNPEGHHSNTYTLVAQLSHYHIPRATWRVMTFILSSVFAIIFFLGVGVDSALDSTRLPNVYGTEVVEAVVNLIRQSCLFADDRRFLRRLAYVESQDGSAAGTYRSGYYGGIWQVKERLRQNADD